MLRSKRKSLGKGEVLSSILSGSTTKARHSRTFCPICSEARAITRRTKHETRKSIRGFSVEKSRFVLGRFA